MQDLGKNRALSDLYLVSALVAYGMRPLRIDRTKPSRQKFIFNAEVPIQVVVEENGNCHWQELALGDIETHFLSKTLFFPGNYPETLKEIRATIHGYIEDMEDASN